MAYFQTFTIDNNNNYYLVYKLHFNERQSINETLTSTSVQVFSNIGKI